MHIFHRIYISQDVLSLKRLLYVDVNLISITNVSQKLIKNSVAAH